MATLAQPGCHDDEKLKTGRIDFFCKPKKAKVTDFLLFFVVTFCQSLISLHNQLIFIFQELW
jgi:hypothetical protein